MCPVSAVEDSLNCEPSVGKHGTFSWKKQPTATISCSRYFSFLSFRIFRWTRFPEGNLPVGQRAGQKVFC